MSMMNTGDILETIEMFTQDNLDVRTVTMGISLLDCIDPDPQKACEKIYNKITTRAARLVPAVEHISAEYGIPIINKRISVTPIAMLLGACPDADPVDFAKTLDAAGKKVGVNFVGGYTALVHKGFSAGDLRLIESIPRALAETDIVCSSVNIGATKAGLNMDAVKLMGEAVKKASELTADRQCIGAAKLVVFCNAPEDNPFMAGAFHGAGDAFQGVVRGFQGRGEAAFIPHGCGQAAVMQDVLQRMEDFRTVAQGFPEGGGALGHDHEFLKVNRGVRMGTAVDDVHHGDGKHLGIRAAQVFEEGQVKLHGGGFCHGQGDTQNGIGAQTGFVGRAVQVNHDFVNGGLKGSVMSRDFRSNEFVDVFHGLENALASVALGVSVAQLPGFMLSGGGSAGDGCAPDGAACQGYVHFHGGVAP